MEGFALWNCGGDGAWWPSAPDLSRCVSGWARELAGQARALASAPDALLIGREVEARAASGRLTGGDAKTLSEALLGSVKAAAASIDRLSKPQQRQSAEELLQVPRLTPIYVGA